MGVVVPDRGWHAISEGMSFDSQIDTVPCIAAIALRKLF